MLVACCRLSGLWVLAHVCLHAWCTQMSMDGLVMSDGCLLFSSLGAPFGDCFAHVCVLPSLLWCSAPVGCCASRWLPGSSRFVHTLVPQYCWCSTVGVPCAGWLVFVSDAYLARVSTAWPNTFLRYYLCTYLQPWCISISAAQCSPLTPCIGPSASETV